MPNLKSAHDMDTPIRIPVPLPHIGSVNTWLLRGDPLTLVDTGPREDEALAALEAGLARAGVRVEDIELVLVTHHHLDHIGPGRDDRRAARAPGSARSTARPPTARDYAERDRGGPPVLARADAPPRRARSRDRRQRGVLGLHPRARRTPTTPTSGWPTARRIRAGGRDLRVVARPGHSTTDALFVDERDAHRVRRRPPARRDLLQHGDLPAPWSPTGRARARGSSTCRACGGRPRCRSPGC